MKVIIEDLVAKVEGKTETELPKETVIRFEIGDMSISCEITSDGLKLYKRHWSGQETINITPINSNSIHVS